MNSRLGIFSVFLFATILLIPASSFSFANAQEYSNNKEDNYIFENNDESVYIENRR